MNDKSDVDEDLKNLIRLISENVTFRECVIGAISAKIYAKYWKMRIAVQEHIRKRKNLIKKKKWIHIRGTLYMCPNCRKRFNFDRRIPWRCCPICQQKMHGIKEIKHE